MAKIAKDKFVHTRVDAQTHQLFMEKSEPLGGVSTVLRAWIDQFIKGTTK
jgi:hypothetical protein